MTTTDKSRAEAPTDALETYSIEGIVRFMRSDAEKQVCVCCPPGGGHIYSRRVEWDNWETNRASHFGNGPDVLVSSKVTDRNSSEGKRVRLTVEVLDDSTSSSVEQHEAAPTDAICLADRVALRTAIDLAECMGTFDGEKAAHLRAILASQPEPSLADTANEVAEAEYFRRWENELPKLDGEAWGRASRAVQPEPPAAAGMAHLANEWADAACNAVVWLKNIRDSISTPAEALAEMESNITRIRASENLHQPEPPAADERAASNDYVEWRLHANGMFGILSEIVGAGALARHGDDDLSDRVELAIANHEQLMSRSTAARASSPNAAGERAAFSLNPLQLRWIKDNIRDAYEAGYRDARANRAIPDDNFPGYRGLEIERSGSKRLVEILERSASSHDAAGAEGDTERALSETIDDRDQMEEIGTRLADAVGEFLGVDVGEWSSANNPILAAIEALESRAPRTDVAEAVAWVRKHPDTGELSGDWLWNDAIEQCRKDSGVWFPLGLLTAPQPPSADAAAEDKYVIERLSTVLAGVASALLGEEADRPAAETLQKLPEEAAKLRLELDLYRAQAADAAAAPADAQAVEAVDYDRVVSICDAHGIGLPVDCIELVVDIVRHAAPPPPAPASATVGMTDALREAREELSLVEWESDPPARVTELFSRIDSLLVADPGQRAGGNSANR